MLKDETRNFQMIKNKFSKNYKPIILLKYKKGQSLVWKGKIKNQTNTNEKPLILNFNNKNFYFYKNEIKWQNSKDYQNYWISYSTELDCNKQKDIYIAFAKTIDKNNIQQKAIAIQLKTECLKYAIQNLEKNIKILNKSYIVQTNNYIRPKFLCDEVKKLNEIIKYSNQKVKTLNRKIEYYDKMFDLENEKKPVILKEYENLKNKIVNYNDMINDLIKISSKLANEVWVLTNDLNKVKYLSKNILINNLNQEKLLDNNNLVKFYLEFSNTNQKNYCLT